MLMAIALASLVAVVETGRAIDVVTFLISRKRVWAACGRAAPPPLPKGWRRSLLR